ncbi:hypothetical protein [Halobacillus litoralis]|uniref:hypothetical protein n=1 Tax=Halobacillus litoralis TaxID=45668 RepID=UPI0013E8E858|nr:hypothetical protein [Halobacillus litoralis]
MVINDNINSYGDTSYVCRRSSNNPGKPLDHIVYEFVKEKLETIERGTRKLILE